jgi:hypothetical protein
VAVRARRASVLIVVLAFAAVFASAGSAGSRDDGPSIPTLYVQYAMNCTFSIVDDQGKPVSSIAPGTYQVEVSTPVMFKLVVPGGPSNQIAPNDFTGCKGWVQFQLTGPGVALSTTLDAGCDAYLTLPATAFKPGSTYVAQDLNQPAATRTTITTLSSGTPTLPPSPYTPTSGKGTPSQDLVGSDIKKTLAGTLTGTLSSKGAPTLMRKGRTVSIIASGRYRFAITDRDAKAGFTLQPVGGKPLALTAPRFVGTHSVTVTLKAGRWTYSSGGGGPHTFLVTS